MTLHTGHPGHDNVTIWEQPSLFPDLAPSIHSAACSCGQGFETESGEVALGTLIAEHLQEASQHAD